MTKKIKNIIAIILIAIMTVTVIGCNKKTHPEFSATIEETVIVDEAGIKITAKDLIYSQDSADLEIEIENNSGKDLTFFSNNANDGSNSINGYMIYGGWIDEDVPTGTSKETTMSFEYDELSFFGIKDIADITVAFTYTEDRDRGNYSHIKPATIKTSIADKYDYEEDVYMKFMDEMMDKGEYIAERTKIDSKITNETINTRGIRSLSTYVLINKINHRQFALIEIVNESNQDCSLEYSDFKLNGIPAKEKSIYQYIRAGKRAVIIINLGELMDSYEKIDNGIEWFSEMSFTLILRNETEGEIGRVPVNIDLR